MQLPTRWNFKRSLSTWLGDVNFQLIMSAFHHIVLATPPTTKMTSHGSINYQKSMASSEWTSMPIAVTGMTISLQTLVARRFTTGWKHTKRLCKMMVLQHEQRGLPKVLESLRRMSRWCIRLCLIASHGKQFQNLAQTTYRCCLCGIRTVERVHARRHTNYPKADWPLFHKCLDNSIHAELSVGSLSKRLEAFCNFQKRAESEVVAIKAVRKREIPWMNVLLKQLIQKRSKLRRDLRTNRKQ